MENTPIHPQEQAETTDGIPCTPITNVTYDERMRVYGAMTQKPIFDRKTVNHLDETEWFASLRVSHNPQ